MFFRSRQSQTPNKRQPSGKAPRSLEPNVIVLKASDNPALLRLNETLPSNAVKSHDTAVDDFQKLAAAENVRLTRATAAAAVSHNGLKTDTECVVVAML